MSADFWAGYISGAAGILIGNPLDLIKVRLQAGSSSVASTSSSYTSQFSSVGSLIRGSAAPILGYGALNALCFMTYNRSSDFLNTHAPNTPTNLWVTWLAGAAGGLATFVVSTPTELIKCRAQLATTPEAASTWGITRDIIKKEGIRGLYFGGVVTVLRDSIGYGFYFWSYQLSTRLLISNSTEGSLQKNQGVQETAKVLFCGGIAGIITWASVFPLDVIKTRVQTQISQPNVKICPLLPEPRRLGAIDIAKKSYNAEGAGVFFRGLAVCSVRAFVVNAVQWAVYEWIMRELDPMK